VHTTSLARRSLLVGIVMTVGACHRWIFSDTFDSDGVGAPPAASPAGNPADDALAFTGSVTVVSSTVVGSNAARLDRGSTPTATTVDLIAGGGANTAGRYRIRWRAYAEADDATLTISLRSASGRLAFRLGFRDGQYGLTTGSGSTPVGAAIALNAVHSFDILVNMDSRTVAVTLDGTALPAQPLLDPTFEGVRMVRLEYPPALVEALPGRYALDFASIRRR
jgi:hypothetical protein